MPNKNIICDSCYSALKILNSATIKHKFYSITIYREKVLLTSNYIITNKIIDERIFCYQSWIYSNPLRAILHQLKYYKQRYLSWHLGYLLYQNLRFIINKQRIDFIITVPMNKQQRQIRGFNHLMLLLNYYLACDNSVLISINVIMNITFDNQIQHKKQQRYQNIILIDDVITTGNTIYEISRLLLLHGANEIHICNLLSTTP